MELTKCTNSNSLILWIFQAKERFAGRGQLEVGVNAGDLLGVIQKKDPMGDPERWYVDNGAVQGFVPAGILAAIGASYASSSAQSTLERKVKVKVNAYDDVAKDEAEIKPTRKAPPVPVNVNKPNVEEKDDVKTIEGHDEAQTGDLDLGKVDEGEKPDKDEQGQNDANDASESKSKGRYEELDKISQDASEKVSLNDEPHEEEQDDPQQQQQQQQPHHPIEAVVEVINQPQLDQENGEKEAEETKDDEEESPVIQPENPQQQQQQQQQQRQDLSPIYEEIHGGTRSTVSSSSSSSSSSTKLNPKGKFHYSLFAFTATDATMLSVGRGQVVRVVQANVGEWWYVEDRDGVRGYVPHSYLKMYPTETAAQPQKQQPDDDPKEST